MGVHGSKNIRSLSTAVQPKRLKPASEIPGPPVYPLVGNVFGFTSPETGPDPTKSLEILEYQWKVHGDIVKFEIPTRPTTLFLFRPDLAEKIYRASGSQPLRPGFDALRYVRSKDPLTNQGAMGLLTSEGDQWYNFRTKVQQPMLRPKSTLRYTPDLESIAEEFISQKIIDARDGKSEVGPDFIEDLYKWALESVTCLALNARLGCLEPNLSHDSHQMQIIRGVSDIFSNSMYLDNRFQFWRFFPSPKLQKFTNGYNTFRDLCSGYINQALADIKNRGNEARGGDPTLLELFIERGCDEATATVMALDMMFAGIDTSSHLAAFAMYQLARHPEVQDKLYAEIKKELPRKDSKLDMKALDRMPYLRATVKEALRTNPPAPIMARILKEPLELDGYQVPGNTVYAPCHYIMSMSERFVDNPKEFMPERWLRLNKNPIHPFLVLPFGHGPRMCVGKRFAEQEVSIFLAKIIQHFKVEWHYGDLKMKIETISKPDGPLRFTFLDR